MLINNLHLSEPGCFRSHLLTEVADEPNITAVGGFVYS
jgi:hypothetical protein